jgi:hypothetical protein
VFKGFVRRSCSVPTCGAAHACRCCRACRRCSIWLSSWSTTTRWVRHPVICRGRDLRWLARRCYAALVAADGCFETFATTAQFAICALFSRLLHCVRASAQPLPIDIRTLGLLAEKCHAYAKALHYKVRAFDSDSLAHSLPLTHCVPGLSAHVTPALCSLQLPRFHTCTVVPFADSRACSDCVGCPLCCRSWSGRSRPRRRTSRSSRSTTSCSSPRPPLVSQTTSNLLAIGCCWLKAVPAKIGVICRLNAAQTRGFAASSHHARVCLPRVQASCCSPSSTTVWS